tara:strand:- start:4869 stop:5981 length:1113 start_codon:yes stop_codon:yes gene_type:complete
MNNYFIVLGAGKGQRFSQKKPKQYFNYNGKTLIEHSIDKALKSKLFKKIVIVISKKYTKYFKKYKKNKILIVNGGKERVDSSINALRRIKNLKPKNVLIHDAARPNFSIKLLKSLTYHLKKNKAVIPVINSKDSVKYKIKNQIYNLERDKSFLTQTPQAFRFKDLYKLTTKEKKNITDESTLFIEHNYKIKFINGENLNKKITYLDDINVSKTFFGVGFDIHKLIKGKKLYLGGAKIPFHSGLKGHSDGDVILHAIIDSILGATQKKDIGTYFPSNKKKYKNIRSKRMLKPILDNLKKNNFYINNIDINLICEKPKVSRYRNNIISSLSKLMKINKNNINLKGKTVEKLGLIGKEKAIACEAITSLTKYD